jgi:glycerol-3-phosphate dehydrogenase
VAATCARNTATVLWAPDPETAEEIKTRHTNSRYFGDLRLAEPLRATADPAAAVANADILAMFVPSHTFRSGTGAGRQGPAAVDSDCQPGERPRTTHPPAHDRDHRRSEDVAVVMTLAAERSVEIPIAAQVDAVLNQRQPVGDAYRGLRQPPPGHELHGEAG